jgi:O-antigen ligase/tetratricopeptide (TPR) repeat protein
MSGARRAADSEKEALSSLTTRCSPLVAYVVVAMEAVLLALICLSPWAYGAVHPGFEFVLDLGIAVLLALWAARMLLEGQITWRKSTVALCLITLFLLGIWQATPLPRPVLAWLSPGAARCYDELLPQQPEILPSASTSSRAMVSPGSTLSLSPGATQREAIRILAVFLVFVVVLNNLTSKEALIRLSWVALINGALLSLFALVQFFSAPPLTVYWTFAAQTTPFGPFICHHHFPDYVNMCIGLGIGLLLSKDSRGHSRASDEQDFSPLQMLRDPRTLWICCALGLMLTAVAFSRSRGGLVALVSAIILCGVLGRLRIGRTFRFGPILVVAGVGMALSAWFGFNVLKDRLATFGTGQAFESRVPLWLRSLPIVPNYPIWGTGYGTFAYVEPMYRKDASTTDLLFWYDHAHNDYLEILVEGGIVGLSLSVLALAAIYRLGFRALAINRGSRRVGLALGALFAFTAFAVHSFADFGAHIPAITLLATVVCAHLCAQGQSRPHGARRVKIGEELPMTSVSSPMSQGKDVESDTYRLRLGGVAPGLGVLVAVGLGLVICADSWKAHRINRLVDAAFRTGNDEADQLRARIACLNEAVSLGPEDARLHYELGFTYGRLGELLLKGGDSKELPRRRFGELLRRVNSQDVLAVREERMLALQEFLRARDACPLMSDAQQGIGVYASPVYMKRGDQAEDYFRRAKLLSPGNVKIWYECGLQELLLMHPLEAWKSWRHCLELSDIYLLEILDLIASLPNNRLSTDQLLEKVLPDKPQILLAAALHLYRDFGSVERRRPFLERALRLLESEEEGPGQRDLLVKARIYRALEQPEQAIPLYRQCLKRDASQVRLRFEFANYLREEHKLEDAHRELTVILAQEPKSGAAKGLLDTVLQEMRQGKSQERKRQRDDWWQSHQRR